jgi:kynurenine formamidase
MGDPDAVAVGADEFRALFLELRSWGRWGSEDQRGALNYLAPERVAAAAELVRSGVTVSLSWPLNTRASLSNPEPADHHMTAYGDGESQPGSTQVAKDYVGVDYHNDTHTHIDALCHFGYEGSLYNGIPANAVSSGGATAVTIEVLSDGLVGRGVLLDVPRLHGRPWLEPGEHVFRHDLERAEADEGVRVEEGDILLVRTGHARRLSELGPWDTADAKSGLHPTAMRFLSERRVAALGCDGNSDTAPSSTEGLAFPIHVLALTAMGLHLLDYLQLEELAAACERAARWEFFFVAAPLRIDLGTGSPLNPIAIL